MPWTESLFSVPLRRLIATFGVLVAEGFRQATESVVLNAVRSIKLCCGGVPRGSSTIRYYGEYLAMDPGTSALGLNQSPSHNDFHS